MNLRGVLLILEREIKVWNKIGLDRTAETKDECRNEGAIERSREGQRNANSVITVLREIREEILDKALGPKEG